MEWRDKRVFVSGGAGVIGTVLTEKLHSRGATVFVGDLKPIPKKWPPDVRYRQGDLNYVSKGELDDFGPEYFFHLAATFERSVETYDFWTENYHNNLRLSHHLMHSLKESQSLKKVIFASSYLIYNPDLYRFRDAPEKAVRLSEGDPISPRNLCGAAKLMHETELEFLGSFANTNFKTVCARIFRGYGRNSRDIVSRWIRSLMKGETITVYRPEGLFDYVFADDVAEGLIRLAQSESTGVVNLGKDNARQVNEVLKILNNHFPKMKKVLVSADIPYEASQANMDHFKRLTGWSPQFQIEDGIKEIIDYESIRDSVYTAPGTQLNILVTSISRKVPLIKALRNANLKLGNSGKIFGADSNPNCIGTYFVDHFWRMQKISELQINQVIDYCSKNNISCIVPTRDGELPFFSKHRHMLREHGITVMSSDYPSVQTCLDKLAFFETTNKLGFPVIKTVENIDEVDCDSYVVKERYGAGSQNMKLNIGKEQALLLTTKLKSPIFQPFIPGKEMSVDLYVDVTGKTKGAVVRARELVVNGESQITYTMRNQRLEELCSDIAESLELYGHVVFQAIIDETDRLNIIECNPRFGGASTLSLGVGLDSFYWFFLEAMGVEIAEYPFLRPREEKRQIRYPEDLVISYGLSV